MSGLIVAAAASHSGKTTVSVGLIAALRARGLRVAAAKCGPDYIDPGFLAAASGAPAINLDPWAMPAARLRARLAALAAQADLVVVEGVMGLFDGGPGGIGSTAALAAATGLPVVLVVGAAGLAQSAAAVAEGHSRLARELVLAGAIVNRVASARHAALIREGFGVTRVPLLGLVRHDPALALPSRHLGLVRAEEHDALQDTVARAAEIVAADCDLAALLAAAATASPPPPATRISDRVDVRLSPPGRKIAVARDHAFSFAYPHLLSDWQAAGAELSFFSPLADERPAPEADAVFLPGGYPELHAEVIAAASGFRAGAHAAAARGALVYGECGGYMVLGEELIDAGGARHRMLGLLPVVTSFRERRRQLGYRQLLPLAGAPWRGPIAGHEFHYASVLSQDGGERLFEARDAAGASLGEIGLRRGRVMGSFAHVIDAL
jgi:cobyrinic acid a,c-diamide synthase